MMSMFIILSCFALATKQVHSAIEVPASSLVKETISKRSVEEPRPSLSHLLQLTSDEQVVADRSITTASGITKTRYHETYKGIPIYDAIVTTDDEGHDVSGTLVKEISGDVRDVTPRITPKQAVNIAMNAEGDDQIRDLEVDVQEIKQFIYLDNERKARLVYRVIYLVESEEKISRPFYIIDAINGDVIDHWQGLDTNHQIGGEGGNKKTGKFIYGGSKFSKLRVTADASKTRCTFNNVNVQVEHMQSKTSSNGQPYSVSCSVGAKDEANGAYSPVNDAMYFGGVVFDMYKNWYNKSPLKTKLYMRVHYGSNYENAFWNGRQMTFGDGRSTFYPLVSLDVTAHEVSHGFTGQNSGLEYRSQSGGMNEAFSDMAGEAAKNYMKGNNDYKVGFDIMKSSSRALRYMDNPPQDGRSIDHLSKYKEGIDVHYSSGIYNKAFYLLSKKSGWTTRKAFEVMVIANSMYWKRQSTFNEGECGVEKAAKDRNYNVKDVKDAFSAVGVSCSGGSTPVAGHKRIIVCEHSGYKTIRCPSGSAVFIIGANYGRLENKCASHSETNCIAYGSTAKTRSICDGKNSCSLLAANSIYGDPCRGVQKFLDVKYACLPTGSMGKTVCEFSSQIISCPSGKVLDISYANYGRLDPETCARYKSINCAAAGVTNKVKSSCNGKSSCRLNASNGLYGDPCSGIQKYLTVKYKCK